MKVTGKYVFFWKESPFCNFTRCEIRLDSDKVFTSSEQMFMWFKATYFDDDETAERILESTSPEEARKLGRLVKNYVDAKWDKVRVDFMYQTVYQKFLQNDDLRKQLCDGRYDGKQFVEAAFNDRIWGIGYNENDALDKIPYWGKNELGKILNKVRDEVKSLVGKKVTYEANHS